MRIRVKLHDWLGPPPSPNEPAVYYGPQEIRDHFDADNDPLAVWVDNATDEELTKIGYDAVWDDRTWATFHTTLTDAIHDHQQQR